MSLIDTHCHLDLLEEKGIAAPEALKKAAKAGVEAIVQIATDLPSSSANSQICWKYNHSQETYPRLYWTAGLHPGNAAQAFQSLPDLYALIRDKAQEEDFVALGETGLDYFGLESPAEKEKQKEAFAAHLSWAKELALPLILHIRDTRSYEPEKTQALWDAYEMLKESQVRGVLHCFSYTHKEALPFVDLGFFVSYSGILSFANAKAIQEGATKLPLACLLVETDAPFLAPQPHRGQVNQPAYVAHTLEFMANLRHRECGEAPQQVKESIYENSQRLLALKKGTATAK